MNSKNVIINTLLLIFIILVFAYIAFLTVVPGILDSNFDLLKFKREVFNVTKLDFQSKKPAFYTTRELGVGVKFNEVVINYPDEKKFADAAKIEIEVALLPLITRTIKFNKFDVLSPNIDLIILPNNKYKIVDFLSSYFSLDALNGNHPKLKKFTIEVTPIVLNNYSFDEPNTVTGKNEKKSGTTLTIEKFQVKKALQEYLTSKDPKKQGTINVK